MALLVASSPCALALGTPATVLAGIAQAARRGVLIKGGVHLENLGTIEALALDKTGTLTIGRPEVTDMVASEGIPERELIEIASSVEQESQHPLARAVIRRAERDGVQPAKADSLESVTGRGVRARVGNQLAEIGNARLFEQNGMNLTPQLAETVRNLQSQGRSVMIVRHAERWLGVLGLADQPREGVKNVMETLRKLGMRALVMLTGDHGAVGEAIGREVGVDEVRAELMPEDKVTAIKTLLEQHKRVAMVGDGVNDAPALAQATVGIAMGGAGTAAALETADVALMADDLGRLPFAIGLSRKARAIIRQNLYLSLGVIALLIVATTTGVFGIGAAVFVHEGSTLVVIGNALRLLTYEVAA
jgi:Zn2+/Cd2+-exporting ATPase